MSVLRMRCKNIHQIHLNFVYSYENGNHATTLIVAHVSRLRLNRNCWRGHHNGKSRQYLIFEIICIFFNVLGHVYQQSFDYIIDTFNTQIKCPQNIKEEKKWWYVSLLSQQSHQFENKWHSQRQSTMTEQERKKMQNK